MDTRFFQANHQRVTALLGRLLIGWSGMLLVLVPATASPQDASLIELRAKELAKLAATPDTDQNATRNSQLSESIKHRRDQFNQTSSAAWAAIHSRQEWEVFRDQRLRQMAQTLGVPRELDQPPAHLAQSKINFTVTGRQEFKEAGFVIENVLYESRPQVWVSANLYRPAVMPQSAPGIIISHAHHTPKEHGELQDMGMTWARAGCYVLVPDHFGHGERRQHPFVSAESAGSYPGTFRVARQDYYFRYDNGIKLHLLGQSLIGWMAWDLSRGLDCLLQQPAIDPSRIILLGAVAGGGDPCAVTAALDKRFTAAVPFNFGGPQPETTYPLPVDAEASFNYAGGGSWESTRSITRSTSDGFLPWLIVGSIAPRRLVYAHEFDWDQERDPVWRRLQAIYQHYDAPKNLSFTHGRGGLKGQAPEATHCTHIGAFHRQRMHEAFRQWFQIDVTADKEYSQRVAPETLRCFTNGAQAAGGGQPSSLVAWDKLSEAQAVQRRLALKSSTPDQWRRELQTGWTRSLGRVSCDQVTAQKSEMSIAAGMQITRAVLTTDAGIQVPVMLLTPDKESVDEKLGVVLVASHMNKESLLQQHSAEYAQLLSAGMGVCLADLRGARLDGRDSAPGRNSGATSNSSSLLMLADPLAAGQLRDLRAVLGWLRTQSSVDSQRIQLWGDSRTRRATADQPSVLPRDDDSRLPPSAEPAGCLVALLAALFEDSIQAVCLTGGLDRFQSVLQSPQVRIPHDCVVPGLLQAGDLDELIAASAVRHPIRIESPVGGNNLPLTVAQVQRYHEQVESLITGSPSIQLQCTPEIAPVQWLTTKSTAQR